jgi:hypothetical protein
MSNTHRVIPLPAYDINGDLIKPHNYKTALTGALVRVNFALSHWYFSSQKDGTSNIFVADATGIRILVDPPTTTTPSKRKTSKKDPEISSPSKKKLKM